MAATPTLDVLSTSEPEEGMLLRFKAKGGALLRITHVFEHSIYVMPYTDASGVRAARRPSEMPLHSVKTALDRHECFLCRTSLPPELYRVEDHPALDKENGEPTPSADDIAYGWIEPLIATFEHEENLRRLRFTAIVHARANELEMCFRTLLRTLLRFYYFGRVKKGLVHLVRGPRSERLAPRGSNSRSKAAHARRRARTRQRARRGRQPIISRRLGRNTFLVEDKDEADMFAAAMRCARKGPSDLKAAHKSYLKTEFAKRHRTIYRAYVAKRRPEPVTYRQFRTRVQEQRCLDRELIYNLPAISADRKMRSGHASGPGEIYEIDATGGRIFLVDENEPDVVLRTPTIYLLIDRWSRFIVSIYVTLGFPSWDEVRYALLVAFTSRIRRFRLLGIEIDEVKRWPVGRMCIALAQDRGSELLSSNYAKACARELRIDPLTLPPLCPDGKAVIERTIRDLKKRMARSGMLAVYAKRPLDPKSKRQARRARSATVTCLRDLYRALVNIVDAKNNAPHAALKKNLMLAQAGVPPVPAQAYLWGCENITGVRVAPFTDADYIRKLLGHGSGSLKDGQVTFEKFKYEPADAAAIQVAARSTHTRKSLDIRFDKTFREEIQTVSATGEWALWRLTSADLKRLRGTTMDEEALLADAAALNTAVAGNDSQIEELTSTAPCSKRPTKVRRHLGDAETRARSRAATRALKGDLLGRKKEVDKPPSRLQAARDRPDWQTLEAEERRRTIVAMRRSDSK